MYDALSVDAGGPPTAAGQGPYYGIEPRAGGSAIFVAAQALSTSWTNANDIPYVNAMIARFKTDLCIDQSRIFATGFSMGAIQTIVLGCGEADVFRAIAPMSGSIQGTCGGTTPIGLFRITRHERHDHPDRHGTDGARHLPHAESLHDHDGRRPPGGLRRLSGVRRGQARQLVRIRWCPRTPAVFGRRPLAVSLTILRRQF